MTIAYIGRRALSACAAAMLVACGQSPTVPNFASPAQSGAMSSARAGCPLRRCIIVGSQSGYKGKPPAAVFFFGRGANRNASPVGEISGSKTG
jgi:hypothetical protein